MDTKQDLHLLGQRLHAFALLRSLLSDEVLAALLALLDVWSEKPVPACASLGGAAASPAYAITSLYGGFAAALYRQGGNLGSHLLQLLLRSDNPAVRLCAAGKPLPAELETALLAELETLQILAELDSQTLIPLLGIGMEIPLPTYRSGCIDFAAEYRRHLADAKHKGYGMFAIHHMFSLDEDGTLLPVRYPDPQKLEELSGYENERAQVIQNTQALLQGLPAGNVLLYGDAGTGKSSTVKAIGNHFAAQGLRLVEVRKHQLFRIPRLMDSLADNPLKFILFIDDLSFMAEDADFTALKAILEGNISVRPGNVVVYATSNRRHMLHQQFASRAGDEVHLRDTLEEESSLAARFGLTVTFLRPDKALYGQIVQALAAEHGLHTTGDELLSQAESYALRHGGRSPRAARQFIQALHAKEGTNFVEK